MRYTSTTVAAADTSKQTKIAQPISISAWLVTAGTSRQPQRWEPTVIGDEARSAGNSCLEGATFIGDPEHAHPLPSCEGRIVTVKHV